MSSRRRDKLRLAASNDTPKKEPEVIAAQSSSHDVRLMKDHKLEIPQLCLNIFFSVPGHEPAFAEMFSRASCRLVDKIGNADLVIFPGGSDVNPKIYGSVAHPKTVINEVRDKLEMDVYGQCLQEGIPMFGVCRGLQFLHVMQGGELFQHVNNHHGDHGMKDLVTHHYIDKVSSTHHQMVRYSDKISMEVLATSVGVSTVRESTPLVVDRGNNNDIEAVFYPEVCALGVQGHPEYRMYARYTIWCLKQIQEKICNNHRITPVRDTKTGVSTYRFQRTVDIEVQ